MKHSITHFTRGITALLALVGFAEGFAQSGQSLLDTLRPVSVTDANALRFYNQNNGFIAYGYPLSPDDQGLFFKNDLSAPLIFGAGFYVAGFRPPHQLLAQKVAGFSEFGAGRILSYGVDPDSLVYEPHDTVTSSIFVLPGDEANWPAEAPHDGSGQPLLLSAADTWAVFNDADVSLLQDDVRIPFGVEIQRMTFQFMYGAMNNAIIVWMRIINKSNLSYDSVYVGGWADCDVGVDWNDRSDADSSLGLAYTYNGSADVKPWTAGMLWLQGPLTDSIGNLAHRLEIGPSGFYFRAIPGKRVLPATAAISHPKQPAPMDIPDYHMLRGMDYFGNPKPLGPFDITNEGRTLRDQRILISSGPFTFAAGDTQNIWYALLASAAASDTAAICGAQAGS